MKDIQNKLAQAAEAMKQTLKGDEVVEEVAEVEELPQELTELTEDQLTTTEASLSSEDVKEDVNEEMVDDKGIPYKNRYHEAARKLKRQEDQLAELSSKLDQLLQQKEEQAAQDLRGTLYDNSFNYAGGTQVQAKRQEAYEEDQESFNETASKTDVYQIVQTFAAKERNDAEALKRFPDLKNPNSVLFKETQRRIAMKAKMGVNQSDPLLVIETAAAAFGDLVATGRLKLPASKQAEEAARRSTADESVLVTSRSAVASKKAEPKLSPMQAHVLNKFQDAGVNINPETYLKRIKKTR